MARKFSEWSFFNQHVQQGLTEGKYLNAAFTLIASGPARLSTAGGGAGATAANLAQDALDLIYPIGVIQSFNLGQQSNVMRLFEIGSERSYFIRGRTVGNLALGRIMYHGPSLLRALKAHIPTDSKFDADAFPTNVAGQTISNLGDANTGTAVEINPKSAGGTKENYRVAPGDHNGNIWLNLASDLFNHPIGLALILKDSNADVVASFYFENCHVNNHGFQTDAGGTVISENAAITFERMLPIDLDNVGLINTTNIGATGSGAGAAENGGSET